MNVTLRKIGNSYGVIIPKEMLDRLGLKEGDSMSLETTPDGFSLSMNDGDLAEDQLEAERFMERYKTALQKLAQ